jgi:hypothetical protein
LAPGRDELAYRALASTRAETEIVGPPQAVNVSATLSAVETPGSVTNIEVTTGQLVSPSEMTSLDCTKKPTASALPEGKFNIAGAMENADPCPVLRTVAERVLPF